jgi:hypothetical protein
MKTNEKKSKFYVPVCLAYLKITSTDLEHIKVQGKFVECLLQFVTPSFISLPVFILFYMSVELTLSAYEGVWKKYATCVR